ncbi:MAG: Ig-like domain-containing protein [Thermoanaerobaculia bacterium]
MDPDGAVTVRPLALRNRPAPLALAAGLVVFLAGGRAGAQPVEIDPFSTSQALLSAPPTSISTVGGAMIDAFRDLEIERLSGTGTSTVEVSGGVLTFTVAAGDRARTSILYDGDGTTAFDPSFVPAFDMTSFDHGSFRLRAAVTGSPASAVVEVYTDAANWSRAAFVLPVGSMTDRFVDLSELQVAAGAGADLSQVRALVLRLTAEDGAVVTVEELFAEPPAVTAAQADFTDAGSPIGGGSVVPGETFRYRVTIANTGGAAQGLDLSDLVDSNLSVVSVRTTPIVRTDQYSGFGNVTLTVDGSSLPEVTANDGDPDGDAVQVLPATGVTTQAGGSADIAADGTFSYTPPAGFNGVDSFAYTLAPVAGDPTADAAGNPVGPFTGTVNVSLDRTVWFVDNSHGGPFDGTQTNPFATLAAAQAASGPGDVIRLRQGDGTTTGYDTGVTLKAGQQLVGGGVDLVIGGQVVEAAGPGRPQLTSTMGDGIVLSTDNTILGLDVVDTGLAGVIGSAVGHLEIDSVAITGAGAEAILVNGGDLDVTLDTLSSDGSPGDGLRLSDVTGALTVTGSTSVTGFTADGIQVDNSPGAVIDFGATTVDAMSALVAPRPEGTGGSGVLLSTNAGATVTFDSLSVAADSGLFATEAGTVNVNSTAATLQGLAGPAIAVHGTAGQTNGLSGWTFQSLVSSDSPTNGVLLDGLTDAFTVGGTTSVTDADSAGILVSSSAGIAFDFGDATVVDTAIGSGATGLGVDLLSSAGATFTFDSLTVTTDGGTGLRANGAGTVSISGTSSINASGGPGVDITGTALAATLQTLSSTNSSGRGLPSAAPRERSPRAAVPSPESPTATAASRSTAARSPSPTAARSPTPPTTTPSGSRTRAAERRPSTARCPPARAVWASSSATPTATRPSPISTSAPPAPPSPVRH